jgi:hypothetical protein
VIDGTDSTGRTNEASRDAITKPDTYPGLPPREPTTHNHGGGNHPGINIETVCNPETDKVPGTPLSPLGFNGLQIMIVEHQLSIGQAWLTFDGQLIHQVGESRRLDLLHYGIEKGGLV